MERVPPLLRLVRIVLFVAASYWGVHLIIGVEIAACVFLAERI